MKHKLLPYKAVLFLNNNHFPNISENSHLWSFARMETQFFGFLGQFYIIHSRHITFHWFMKEYWKRYSYLVHYEILRHIHNALDYPKDIPTVKQINNQTNVYNFTNVLVIMLYKIRNKSIPWLLLSTIRFQGVTIMHTSPIVVEVNYITWTNFL